MSYYSDERRAAAQRELDQINSRAANPFLDVNEAWGKELHAAYEPLRRNLTAIIKDQPPKALDWLRLAELIAAAKPEFVTFGMLEDWGPTADDIYRAGAPLGRASVAVSTWATPAIQLDPDTTPVPMFIEGEAAQHVGKTWPPEALEILRNAQLVE